ncbi:MAG: hypothetical protein HYZ44_04860 [Bacteroidetes bacterium]|nr:hypothetical protein [Bacteroidota bacterium]
MTRILLFLMMILVGASCFNEPDCIVTATTSIKMDFKQTKTDKTTLLKSVVDSALILKYVKVSGITSDYMKDSTTSTVTLPINPKEKTITYYLFRQSKSGATTRLDSIKFSFSEESRVIAPKCGAYTFFLDLKVVQTSFGQTQYKITSTRLLKNTTNVQVYF